MHISPHRLLRLIVLSLLGLGNISEAGWFSRNSDSSHIVIVRGTISLRETGERPFAASLANQTSQWLDELGLPHSVLTDEEISPKTLRNARAVILPYNPNPTPLELEAFRDVIKAGGILVVCYGMDPALAELMGFKLEPYRHAERKGQWSGFSFAQSGIPGFPDTVRQTSDHLVPVIPVARDARVLAYWNDASGSSAAEPAWVQSHAGYWMSHVLLPGDDETKKHLLLAILSARLPEAWKLATDKLLDPDRPFGNYMTLAAAKEDLGMSPAPKRNLTLASLFSHRTDVTSADYLAARAMRSELTRRYANRQEFGRTLPLRGIWVGAEAANNPALGAQLSHLGFNTVFLNVGHPLALIEDSSWPTPSASSLPALHAWLTCLNSETSTQSQIQELKAQGRLQVSDTGQFLTWLCPSHPANRALVRDAASRLARSGHFAGIHLDYIRCNNSHSCYCAGCRERFEKTRGRVVIRWPDDVQHGALTATFRQWRAEQITTLVTEICKAVRDINPALKVSAAVYGATPSCFETVAQDWPNWIGQGGLDFVSPMNYTADLGKFETLLKTQSQLPSANRIIPGIGASSTLSRLTPDQTVAELAKIRDAGFQGFALFEFSPALQADMLQYLNLKRGDSR